MGKTGKTITSEGEYSLRTKVIALVLFMLVVAATVGIVYKVKSDEKDAEYQLAEKPVFFIHVPKTGGISVKESIPDEWYHGHTAVKDMPGIEDHYKFTVVRNPWDRTVSAYNFLKKGGLGGSDIEDAARMKLEEISFEEFLRDLPQNSKWQQHLRPQVFWMRDSNGVNKADFVAKMESLDADWKKLSKKLGLKQKKLPHSNKSRSDDYRNWYQNAEMKDIVADVYRDDIAEFGYEF